MSISEIYNVVEVNDRLITAGQPTEEQLRAAAADDIDTIINLAPGDSRSALPDEAALVRTLGMTYHHIPVAWDNPTEADFAAFEEVMTALPPESRTLLHCAANFRVSAFYGLYGITQLGWSIDAGRGIPRSDLGRERLPRLGDLYSGDAATAGPPVRRAWMTLEVRDPDFERRVRETFGRQEVMALLGASLARVEAGEIDIDLPFSDQLTQQHGFMHAGAVTWVLDGACGYAPSTLSPSAISAAGRCLYTGLSQSETIATREIPEALDKEYHDDVDRGTVGH